MTLIANQNLVWSSPLGVAQIENLSTGATNLVVDNANPIPFAFGNNGMTLGTLSLLNANGVLRLFTSSPSSNQFNALINGVTFVEGEFGDNTQQQQWEVYFPSTFFGGPGYTIFYKTEFDPQLYLSGVSSAQMSDDLPIDHTYIVNNYNVIVEERLIKEEDERLRNDKETSYRGFDLVLEQSLDEFYDAAQNEVNTNLKRFQQKIRNVLAERGILGEDVQKLLVEKDQVQEQIANFLRVRSKYSADEHPSKQIQNVLQTIDLALQKAIDKKKDLFESLSVAGYVESQPVWNHSDVKESLTGEYLVAKDSLENQAQKYFQEHQSAWQDQLDHKLFDLEKTEENFVDLVSILNTENDRLLTILENADEQMVEIAQIGIGWMSDQEKLSDEFRSNYMQVVEEKKAEILARVEKMQSKNQADTQRRKDLFEQLKEQLDTTVNHEISLQYKHYLLELEQKDKELVSSLKEAKDICQRLYRSFQGATNQQMMTIETEYSEIKGRYDVLQAQLEGLISSDTPYYIEVGKSLLEMQEQIHSPLAQAKSDYFETKDELEKELAIIETDYATILKRENTLIEDVYSNVFAQFSSEQYLETIDVKMERAIADHKQSIFDASALFHKVRKNMHARLDASYDQYRKVATDAMLTLEKSAAPTHALYQVITEAHLALDALQSEYQSKQAKWLSWDKIWTQQLFEQITEMELFLEQVEEKQFEIAEQQTQAMEMLHYFLEHEPISKID